MNIKLVNPAHIRELIRCAKAEHLTLAFVAKGINAVLTTNIRQRDIAYLIVNSNST